MKFPCAGKTIFTWRKNDFLSIETWIRVIDLELGTALLKQKFFLLNHRLDEQPAIKYEFPIERKLSLVLQLQDLCFWQGSWQYLKHGFLFPFFEWNIGHSNDFVR